MHEINPEVGQVWIPIDNNPRIWTSYVKIAKIDKWVWCDYCEKIPPYNIKGKLSPHPRGTVKEFIRDFRIERQ